MTDEELDLALSGLPTTDIPPERAEAIREKAHLALRESASVRSLYARVVEPAVVLALCAVQLLWVADALSRVFSH